MVVITIRRLLSSVAISSITVISIGRRAAAVSRVVIIVSGVSAVGGRWSMAMAALGTVVAAFLN